MDPDTLLQHIRTLIRDVRKADDDADAAAAGDQLANVIDILDGYLSTGGTPPDAWLPSTPIPTTPPDPSSAFGRGYRLALDHVRTGTVTPEGEYLGPPSPTTDPLTLNPADAATPLDDYPATTLSALDDCPYCGLAGGH